MLKHLLGKPAGEEKALAAIIGFRRGGHADGSVRGV
jgi:hypothetical protein